MKKMKVSVLMAAMFLMMAVSAHAGWYACKITNITPKSNGSVAVKFNPGTGVTNFVGQGRATINPIDNGAKNMLATLLTAVSLNREVTLDLTTVPTQTYQDIYGVSLLID